MQEKALIVIPAKSESNRIPAKNMKTVGGKSLVYRALVRSVQSGIGDVVVSSDSDVLKSHLDAKIPKPGPKWGFLKRPKYLSGRNTRVFEVLQHVLKRINKDNQYTTVLLTLPTTPFLTGAHMLEAYDQFLENRVPLFCITKMERRNTLLLRKDNEDFLCPWADLDLDKAVDNSYGDAYVANGGLFICDVRQFMEELDYYKLCPKQGYEVEPNFGLDIDTPFDLVMANALLRWEGEK